ncbi:hypothetical protein IAU60_000298 [Kwoniella sp. DSM 27419]
MKGRRAYTCTPCRERKVKCDRHRSCGPCKRRGLTCVWPDNGVPLDEDDRGRPTSSGSITPEPTRLSSTSGSWWHSARRRQSRSRSPILGSTAHRSSDVPAGPVEVPHTVASAEELDHSILNDSFGGSTSIRTYTHAREHQPRKGGSVGEPSERPPSFPFGGGRGYSELEGDGMVNKDLMAALPLRAQADVMLRIYLERVEWIHHPLHLPTFLAQYNRFWSMSTAKRCETVHARWLALLYITLALGAHFSDEEGDADAELADGLRDACEATLASSDFLDRPSTETVQTIISLNIYLNNNNRVMAAKNLLGTAIKMAIVMGMSRIPNEETIDDPDGAIERELGRRLWWSLVCQDAYTASNSGFTYSINLSHASTGLFANVEDDDILPGSAYHSRPLGEVTGSTFHICKIQFALVVRDFIDAINANFPNASYEDIMALDAKFRRAYDALPLRLRPDLPQAFELSYAGSQRYLVEQRIFMGVTLHNRLMRLHRAYMVRGYDDPGSRYAYSTRVCIESAYALLDLVKQSTQTLCRWWVVLVHVWTSGLIISADLVRGSAEEATRSRQREGVRKAIALLEPTAKASPVAQRGVKVLKACLQTASAEPHAAVDGDRRQVQGSNQPGVEISPLAMNINSIADLEQLLRDAASAQPFPADAPDPVADEQSLQFWQSLFQLDYAT